MHYYEHGVRLPVSPEAGEAVDGVMQWQLGVLDDGRIVLDLNSNAVHAPGATAVSRALSPQSARTLGRELQRLAAKFLGEER